MGSLAVRLLLTLALACIAPWAAAQAPAFPAGPVKIVIGYAAGGPLDVVARLIAQDMSETLGRPVVVENRPGASGLIATQAVAQATPDGYTVLFVPSTFVVNPMMMEKVAYDPVADFTPIAGIASLASIAVATGGGKIDSMKALIDAARASPGAVTYGSSGIGGPAHLAAELLQAQTGVQMTHVPFKGTAPALTEVVAGRVTFLFHALSGLKEFIVAGRIRPLAVSGTTTRLPDLPDVPTMAEAGFPGYEDVGIWFGVVGPKGVPAPVVATLNAAVQKSLAKPETRTRLAGLGAVITGGSPSDFAAFLRRDVSRWDRIIKATGIKVTPG